MQFDYLVIGKGLIGAAAARYLSATGQRTALLGPDEPSDWANHEGVFASHYDQGRITRILDADPVWARLAKRAINAYPELEAASGINFHFPVGQLKVAPSEDEGFYNLRRTAEIGLEFEAVFGRLTPDELASKCRWFKFPAGYPALIERGAAGYIHPRRLVEAQVALFAKQGGQLIRQRVTQIRPQGEGFAVQTEQGQTVPAANVLVAAGAYSNSLLPQPLQLSLRARTVLLAEVNPIDTGLPPAMPTLIYRLANRPDLVSIYLVPPVTYPDGRTYLKIGGSHEPVVEAQSEAELNDWFQQGGSVDEAESLKAVLSEIMPALKVIGYQHKPCVTTYTAHDHPYLGQVAPNLFVAVGGCGASAKSSDAIGHVAADLVAAGQWVDPDLHEIDFAPQFV